MTLSPLHCDNHWKSCQAAPSQDCLAVRHNAEKELRVVAALSYLKQTRNVFNKYFFAACKTKILKHRCVVQRRRDYKFFGLIYTLDKWLSFVGGKEALGKKAGRARGWWTVVTSGVGFFERRRPKVLDSKLMNSGFPFFLLSIRTQNS